MIPAYDEGDREKVEMKFNFTRSRIFMGNFLFGCERLLIIVSPVRPSCALRKLHIGPSETRKTCNTVIHLTSVLVFDEIPNWKHFEASQELVMDKFELIALSLCALMAFELCER